MRVSAQMAQDVIPHLPDIYDEPFADSSQIPTHLICKLARQHVTVALSGDAGDELFGGYNRYFWGRRIWSRLAWMPFQARKIMGKAICAVPAEALDSLSRVAGVSRLGDRAHKLAARLSSVRGMDDLYWSLVTEWPDPAAVVKGAGSIARSPWESNETLPPGLNSVERMMFRDALTYLPDDILCKVDRAAMACSLETRVPFLDQGVIELAWQMPLHMKIRDNTSKWALRQVLYKYVPKELIERPKAGFAIPIGHWLRGPLRDWAENLLVEARLGREGYFYPEPIRRAWREHLSGRHDHTPKIWSILMFQAWLETQTN
jgi:asparagine synthase (glutamine-hydrolysing)